MCIMCISASLPGQIQDASADPSPFSIAIKPLVPSLFVGDTEAAVIVDLFHVLMVDIGQDGAVVTTESELLAASTWPAAGHHQRE